MVNFLIIVVASILICTVIDSFFPKCVDLGNVSVKVIYVTENDTLVYAWVNDEDYMFDDKELHAYITKNGIKLFNAHLYQESGNYILKEYTT